MSLTFATPRAPARGVACMRALLLAWLAACGSAPAVRPVPPVPSPIDSGAPTPPAPVVHPVRAEAAGYAVISEVTSWEEGVTPPRRDSTRLAEVVSAAIVLRPDGFDVVVRSDSGVAGRPAAPPRRFGPVPPAPAPVALTARAGPAGVFTTGADSACRAVPTLLSPVVPLAIARALPASGNGAAADTVTYTSCAGGTRLRVAARVGPGRTTRDGTWRAPVEGTVQGDSTRAFPMHVDGRFRGDVTVTPAGDAVGLPEAVVVRLELAMRTSNARREQRVGQRTETRLARR